MIRTSSCMPVCSSNSAAWRSTLATYASVSGPRKRTTVTGRPYRVGRAPLADARGSSDHCELETEQVCHLVDPPEVVAHAERDVVGRALRAPGVHERPRAEREAQPRVGVSDPEGRPRDRLAL